MQNGLAWVFQKLTIYWEFPTQSSRRFIANGIKRKHPVSSSKLKMTRFLRNMVCRRAFLHREHVEPWSRWATAADICQKRKLKLINCMASKIWQQKIKKMLLRLMSLDFFCYIQIVGSKWHENYESMDQTWRISTFQADSSVMVWVILSWHTLFPLVLNEHV